jgi:hypothetical protein
MPKSRFPVHIIALMIALALGGFAVSITGSRAVFTVFAIVYISVLAGWVAMTLRDRS